MLTNESQGRYIVRVAKLATYPDLVGQVIKFHELTKSQIVFEAVNNCRPTGKILGIPLKHNDGGWRDVTDLVASANSAVLPPLTSLLFSCENASNYRNFLDIIPKPVPISMEDAQGSICLIGKVHGAYAQFAKVGHYIVDSDSDGYAIAYYGYCLPPRELKGKEPLLKILRLVGSDRDLFPAAPIVNSCNNAYTDDVAAAIEYRKIIFERTMASSVDKEPYNIYEDNVRHLSEMRLG